MVQKRRTNLHAENRIPVRFRRSERAPLSYSPKVTSFASIFNFKLRSHRGSLPLWSVCSIQKPWSKLRAYLEQLQYKSLFCVGLQVLRFAAHD